MRTLESLKRLAVKLTPCGSESAAVGNTIDEVIDYIASHCNVNCNKLCIKDSDGAFYDVTVSTNGALVVTPKVKVATPVFEPASGTFEESQSVTLTCATAGATIYYTTDGSDPTKESSVYSEAITLSATTTIKAFADKDGCTDSNVATATYTKTE